MKKLFILLGLLCVFVSCKQSDPAEEKKNVEAAITEFYDAVQQFNFEAIPTFATNDFEAYEEGYTYDDIDGFVNVLRSFEGAKTDMKLDFVKTEVSGDMAFSIVTFDISVTMDPVLLHFQTYEDYILKKVDGNWLIQYFHSTHLPNPDDKNLSSIHFLKVPESLSVADLQEYLNKLNEAIASLGYTDCGYKLMTAVPESKDVYNFVVVGKWINEETYKIIHESDAYKKVTESLGENMMKFFKGQIYVKAQEDTD